MSPPFPPSCPFFLHTVMSILLYRTTSLHSVHHRLSATAHSSGHGHDPSKKRFSCKVDVGMSRITIMIDTRISMPMAMCRYDRWCMVMSGWMVHGYVLHPWMSPHIPRDPFPEFSILKSVPSVGVQRKEVPTLHHPNPPFAISLHYV